MTARQKRRADKIIFVTGTDTGVGKTVLTGLLLHHLRQSGIRALAMKPFCSGDRADVHLLRGLQDEELEADEINPFFFEEPVAPLVACRRRRQTISFSEVMGAIDQVAVRCERLLVEGVGGVLVPLGERYSVADLIGRLKCRAVVASINRLGTINHTRLTVAALQRAGVSQLKVVLMETGGRDLSKRSNVLILNDLLAPVPVLSLPDLGRRIARISTLKKMQKKVKKTLASILG